MWCSGDDDCSHTVGAHFVRTELVADSIGRVMSREPTGDTHFEIYKKAGTLSHVCVICTLPFVGYSVILLLIPYDLSFVILLLNINYIRQISVHALKFPVQRR